MNNTINFIFFGSSPISVSALNALKSHGLLPVLVVTQPDKPQGRHLTLVPSPVKLWAIENNIPVSTPVKIRTEEFSEELKKYNAIAAVLVSYGKIIPQNILDLFPKGILNLHPSMLPKLRGPSPIEGAILNDMKDEVGVTVMLLDKEMDHGPLLAQKEISIKTWIPKKSELYDLLSKEGGELLAETFEKWVAGKITPIEQDHSKATYCEIIKKSDGQIDLNADGYKNLLKVRAYEGWPGTYFFITHDGREMRVKIADADFVDGKFEIKKVVPEGKREMDYADFLRGYGGNE